jgi:hypothetical protein
MTNIISFNEQEHKQCAYKNCENSGSKKLQILYIKKEGWFCERCANELILNNLIKDEVKN